MRFRNSGIGSDGEQLAAPGQKPGAAVLSLPGSQVHVVVEAGAEVLLPDNIPARAVLSACPSLSLVKDASPVHPAPEVAPEVQPAPAEKRKRAAKE